MEVLFFELSLVIVLATVITIFMRMIKQPTIIGYIITGIIVGPLLLNIISSVDLLSTFAQLGVALLLFIVGLSLNPTVMKELGRVSVLTGVCQVLLTGTVGFFISLAIGFSVIESLYIGVALTFSSTIVIMKLLSDKQELDTLHGKISIGFLIVQDIIAIFLIMVLSMIGIEGTIQETVLSLIFRLVVVFFILLSTMWVASHSMLRTIAQTKELLFLFSIAFCLVFSSFLSFLGFPMEIGALIAGVALSSTPFSREIVSRIKPLRDFFIILFFVVLGSQITMANIEPFFVQIVIFSIFIIVGNPLILMIIMGWMGYGKKTSFYVGLASAQVSEFSFILVAIGESLGHLSQWTLPVVTLVGLITMVGSSYLILHANTFYRVLSNQLSFFERKKRNDFYKDGSDDAEVILFGCDRIGRSLIDSLKKITKHFLVIDYNPTILSELAKEDVDCLYGDANDLEFLDRINFKKTKIVVSTIPDKETSLSILGTVKKENKKAVVIVTANQVDDALEFYKKGASYVVSPYFLCGEHLSLLTEKCKSNKKLFENEGKKQIKLLYKRKKYGHEHPLYE